MRSILQRNSMKNLGTAWGEMIRSLSKVLFTAYSFRSESVLFFFNLCDFLFGKTFFIIAGEFCFFSL